MPTGLKPHTGPTARTIPPRRRFIMAWFVSRLARRGVHLRARRPPRKASTSRMPWALEPLESRQLLNADVAPDAPTSTALKDTAYPIPASGPVYYVAPGATDANAGTPTSPWSLRKAL